MLTNRKMFQNAWVVDDLETACEQWAFEFGVGPFFVSEYRNVFEDVIYRGQPGKLDMLVALAQNGPIQIELIQPLVDQCAYRDSVPSGTGFHHMCVFSDNFEEDHKYLTSKGYVAANTARVGNVAFGYYDTRSVMGCMLETVTSNPATEERFAQIAAAGERWDGKTVIQEWR